MVAFRLRRRGLKCFKGEKSRAGEQSSAGLFFRDFTTGKNESEKKRQNQRFRGKTQTETSKNKSNNGPPEGSNGDLLTTISLKENGGLTGNMNEKYAGRKKGGGHIGDRQAHGKRTPSMLSGKKSMRQID